MLAFYKNPPVRDFQDDVIIITFANVITTFFMKNLYFTTFSYGLRCYNYVVIYLGLQHCLQHFYNISFASNRQTFVVITAVVIYLFITLL